MHMEEETRQAEPQEPVEEPKIQKASNKTKTKKSKKTLKIILLVLIVVVLSGASAGAAYWWRDKSANDSKSEQTAKIASLEKEKASLKKQLSEAKAQSSVITDETDCEAESPSSSATENIEASITSGNTAALESYMATSVNVILAASEGIGSSTPTEAVSAITDFISSDITSWDYDFSLSAAALNSYAGGSYSQYFPNDAIVGKATNDKVISFSFDCNSKISTVLLSNSEEILQ